MYNVQILVKYPTVRKSKIFYKNDTCENKVDTSVCVSIINLFYVLNCFVQALRRRGVLYELHVIH